MFKQEFILKALRFGVVGLLVTVVFIGLNIVFSRYWGKQLGYFAALGPALTLHFLLNKKWTFHSKRRDEKRQVAEYGVMTLVTQVSQWAVFTLLAHKVGLSSGWASAIASATMMVVTFITMNRRIFAPQRAGS